MDDWNAFYDAPSPGNDDIPDLARAAAQVWASAPGRLLLEHLSDITLGRKLAPSATDAELRHLEGQRALVHHVKFLILKGRNHD